MTNDQKKSSFESQIFLNLPIKDLKKSTDFFTKLGFSFNLQYTNEDATCMIISDRIYVMLLVEKFFQSFIKKEIADSKKFTEAIIGISLESKQKVDELIEKAKASGAMNVSDAIDHGFMYTRNFEDLDGHIWEIFWLDPNPKNNT